jgi:hypothetical protein
VSRVEKQTEEGGFTYIPGADGRGKSEGIEPPWKSFKVITARDTFFFDISSQRTVLTSGTYPRRCLSLCLCVCVCVSLSLYVCARVIFLCPHAPVDTKVTLQELVGETENEEKGKKTTRVGPKTRNKLQVWKLQMIVVQKPPQQKKAPHGAVKNKKPREKKRFKKKHCRCGCRWVISARKQKGVKDEEEKKPQTTTLSRSVLFPHLFLVLLREEEEEEKKKKKKKSANHPTLAIVTANPKFHPKAITTKA